VSSFVPCYVLQELLECIQSIAASEVTMKLQCSNGLKATDYYGCGDFDPKRSEVKVGGLDRQSSSCFVLSFDSDSFLGKFYDVRCCCNSFVSMFIWFDI
jgi:hypothetical protein